MAVQNPDRFLRDRLASTPDLVVQAVEAMTRRLKRPPQTPAEIAALLTKGKLAPRFGAELLDALSP